MSYRGIDATTEHRSWTIIHHGPEQYKIMLWRPGDSFDRCQTSSPIVAPLALLGQVLEGEDVPRPVMFRTWSGNTYSLHGPCEQPPSDAYPSAIMRPKPPKLSWFEQLKQYAIALLAGSAR